MDSNHSQQYLILIGENFVKELKLQKIFSVPKLKHVLNCGKTSPETNSSYKFGNFCIEQEICNKMLPFTCNGRNRAKFCPFYFLEKT